MCHKKEVEVYMLNESHCEPLRALWQPLVFLATFVLLLRQPLGGLPEHLRVEGIGGHLSNSGLQPCPRMARTKIRTAGLVACSRPGGRKRKTAQDGNILASASSLRIGTEAPLTMNFVLAHCPDIVGMTPAPPRRQTMRSPSHAPSPSHSLFALR